MACAQMHTYGLIITIELFEETISQGETENQIERKKFGIPVESVLGTYIPKWLKMSNISMI